MKSMLVVLLLSVSVSAQLVKDPASGAYVPAPVTQPTVQSVVKDQSPTIQVPLTQTSLDLGSIVKTMHPCYVLDQHLDHLAGAYVHLLQFHDANSVVYVDINGGLVWRATDGVGGPLGSVGFRADNLLNRILGTDWGQKHITGIKLPALEVGPVGGFVPNLGWIYGAFAALSF